MFWIMPTNWDAYGAGIFIGLVLTFITTIAIVAAAIVNEKEKQRKRENKYRRKLNKALRDWNEDNWDY